MWDREFPRWFSAKRRIHLPQFPPYNSNSNQWGVNANQEKGERHWATVPPYQPSSTVSLPSSCHCNTGGLFSPMLCSMAADEEDIQGDN